MSPHAQHVLKLPNVGLGSECTRPCAHAAATSGARSCLLTADSAVHQRELAAVKAAAGRPSVHCGSSAAAQTAACGCLCVIIVGIVWMAVMYGRR